MTAPVPTIRIWIPLSWRRRGYITSQGKAVRRSERALVVSTKRDQGLLTESSLLVRFTYVKPRKPR